MLQFIAIISSFLTKRQPKLPVWASLWAVFFFGLTQSQAQILISGYMANPPSTDAPYEYVQLVATQAINFAVTPYSLVWNNNGTAASAGWAAGAALSYKFDITTGSVTAGQVFYVGGSGKLINGAGSTDISSLTWVRTINNGTTAGDGLGTANASGNFGNGGTNADGVAVFSGTTVMANTIPIDAVFFGTGIGTANPATGGYVLPTNDLYNNGQGTFGDGTNTFIFADPAGGAFIKFSGTYNTISSTWTTARTANVVASPTQISDITSVLTLVFATPEINVKGNNVTISDGDASPSTLDNTDFGAVAVGNNLTKTYVIENTGTGTLNISNITLTGANSAEFAVTSATTFSINGGSSQNITVQFTPTVTTVRTATLNILSDDTDEATYDIALQGGVVTVPYTLAFNRTNASINEANGTAQIWAKVTVVGNTSGTVDLATSAYTNASNPADYTVAATTINVPNTLALNDSVSFTFNLVNDALVESDEYIIAKLSNGVNVTFSATAQHTLYITDNDRIVPEANHKLSLNLLGSFSNGTAFSGPTQINSAEISAYDALSKNIYIANSIGSKLDIVDFSNPAAPVLINSINISAYGAINSVAVRNGLVALAIENTSTQQDSGKVVLLDTAGVFIKQVTVGMMPDMIVFNHAGTKIYTANEAQPNESYNIDPDGSISVVDISAGAINATVSHITFTAYNGQETALRAQGIRIFGLNASASQDFEPEYITISDDDSKAWVTLQENNALAELNLSTNTITSLIPLGYKNHNVVGNGLDASDQTAKVNISNFPVKGMYQPDAIAQYTAGGNIYLLTANEGDARAYIGFSEETRVGSLTLDPTAFPNSTELKNNAVLGRLRTTNKLGDTDNDGDIDEIYSYGSRSFSIWNGTSGNLVYDSGSQLEEITANDSLYGAYFNFNSGGARKDRSDDKGPEAEGVTTANVNGKQYAFVGMERTGGVIVYDVTDPNAPEYVTYSNSRPTDVSPEGIFFIPANESPNGKKLLVLSNEISSTLTVYEVAPCQTVDSTITVSACVDYTINSITYTSTGNYTQNFFNAAGCDSTLHVNVTITGYPAAPTITASHDTVCAGTIVTLNVTAAMGQTGIEYLWYKNGVAVNSGTANTYVVGTGSTAGIDKYTVEAVYTGFACLSIAADTISIVKNTTAVSLTPAGATTFCANNPTTLNANAGMANYVWKRSTSPVQSGASASYIPTLSGNYSVTVTAANGCSKTSTWLNIVRNVLPTANAGTDKNICVGTSVQIGSTNNAANTYVWSPNSNLSNATISNPLASPAANATYILTVTNTTTGCLKKDTVLLTSLARPAKPAFNVVAPGSTGVQCEGVFVTLNQTVANNGTIGSILWYKNNATLYTKAITFDAVISASNATTDYYKIKSKGVNGCFSVISDSLPILIKAAPIPTITAAAPATQAGTLISIPCIQGATSGTAALSGAAGMNAYTWQQLVAGAYTNVGTGMNYNATVSTTANNKSYRLVVTYPNACSRASVNNVVKLLTGCREGEDKGGVIIGQELTENSLNTYPNPTQDVLHIDLTSIEANTGKLVLYNALGQEVWAKEVILTGNKASEIIDMRNLAAGIYSLSFQTESSQEVQKIVKE